MTSLMVPSEEHWPLTRVPLSRLHSSWWRQTSSEHTFRWGRNADIWSDPARLSVRWRTHQLGRYSPVGESVSSLFGRHCHTTVRSGVNTPWHRWVVRTWCIARQRSVQCSKQQQHLDYCNWQFPYVSIYLYRKLTALLKDPWDKHEFMELCLRTAFHATHDT